MACYQELTSICYACAPEAAPRSMGAFLKTVDGRILLFVLLVQLGQAQSRTHKIVCPDGPSRGACDLFNEAVEDDDENIYKASMRDHVLVCLRPNSNLFLLLSYDLPRDNLWKDKSGGGVQQSGSADFLRFINGNPNFGGESLFAVGLWLSTSRDDQRAIRFQGSSLPPPGIADRTHVDFERGDVAIDSSHISISKHYFEDKSSDQPRLLKDECEFSLTTSTNEFTETTRSPGAPPISGAGRCVLYK